MATAWSILVRTNLEENQMHDTGQCFHPGCHLTCTRFLGQLVEVTAETGYALQMLHFQVVIRLWYVAQRS